MYSIQHFNFHDNHFLSPFRAVVHFFSGILNFILDLMVSFQKARAASIIAASGSYDLEEFKKVLLEK